MSTYSTTVWFHFREPKNVGRLENPDGEGFAGGRRAGPFMSFTARLKGDVLEEVRFQTYGCAPAIAAGSYLSEEIRGKGVQDAAQWDVPRLLEALGGLPDDKLHCATLAIAALKDLTGRLSEKLHPCRSNFLDRGEGGG